MIWTMNQESSTDSKIKQGDRISQNQIQTNIGIQMTQNGRLRPKRKRGDADSAKMSPNPESRLKISDAGDCDCRREIPASSVQRLDDPLIVESSSIDKKELRILRMQIAMISDADGDRPIHVAVVQQNFKLVQKLCAIMLKTAISIDLTNYLRQTPLHLAVMLGNVDMVKLLLKCGSSVTLKDRNGNSVIHLAVKTNAKKEVLCLILSHPQASTILNSMDHEGYTALHYAVLKRNKTAVTCLHRSKANMDVTDGKSGRTALIHAIMEKNTDMVNHLLACDVSVDIVDYSGRSAFELALQASNEEIVKLLEKKMFEEEFSKSSSAKDTDEEMKESVASRRTKKFKCA